MPDGGAPVLSIVNRALTVTGWRAVRRALPADLRRSMPVTPPAHRGVALGLLGDTLRKRSRRRADEDEPKWRPRIADVATAYGVHRDTIDAWLNGTTYRREHGHLVIRGLTALRIARKVFVSSPPRTMEEAIARMDADLQRRVREPKVWRSMAGDAEPIVEAPKFPELGSGPASIDQLASLLASPDQRSFAQYAAAGQIVRDALSSLERKVGPIDPEWLRSGMGQAFWISVLDAAEKKSRKKKA